MSNLQRFLAENTASPPRVRTGFEELKKKVRWPVSRVLFRPVTGPLATIHLGDRLRDPSCNQPGQQRGGGPPAYSFLHRKTHRRVCPYSVLLRAGLALTDPIAGIAVRSYRTLSALPDRSQAVCFCGAFPWIAPAERYSAPCRHGARTFLTPKRGAAARPSDLGGKMGTPKHRVKALQCCHLYFCQTSPSRKLEFWPDHQALTMWTPPHVVRLEAPKKSNYEGSARCGTTPTGVL